MSPRIFSHSRMVAAKTCFPSATFNADGSSPWASQKWPRWRVAVNESFGTSLEDKTLDL
jgi:hypothetical protein